MLVVEQLAEILGVVVSEFGEGIGRDATGSEAGAFASVRRTARTTDAGPLSNR